MVTHRCNLFIANIGRQQGSEELPTDYGLNRYVEGPRRKNCQNFYTSARSELTSSSVKTLFITMKVKVVGFSDTKRDS
jgi:hypothetical protein